MTSVYEITYTTIPTGGPLREHKCISTVEYWMDPEEELVIITYPNIKRFV